MDEVCLVHPHHFVEGDVITIASDSCGFVLITIDNTTSPYPLYLDKTYLFPVPFGEKRICYAPGTFSGDIHYIHIRTATLKEIKGYRNLTINPFDCHQNSALYPHARANVETRGEAAFESRNAIDGFKANHGHGMWPYSSWGINQNPDAKLSIDFGRKVSIDTIVFYLRTDFPHDAWWTSADITTDTATLTVNLTKTDKGQSFLFKEPLATRTLSLEHLIKADDPSPFPALTQIEAWGKEA